MRVTKVSTPLLGVPRCGDCGEPAILHECKGPRPDIKFRQREWQPIATAPKDGTRILLGRFVPGDEYDGHMQVDRWWSAKDKRSFVGFAQFNPTYWPPTHWQHLPAPPIPVSPPSSQSPSGTDGAPTPTDLT